MTWLFKLNFLINLSENVGKIMQKIYKWDVGTVKITSKREEKEVEEKEL